MNESLECIKNMKISEIDLVKYHISFFNKKQDSCFINWQLSKKTIEELKKIGVIVQNKSDCAGDYSNVIWG